MNKDLGPQCWSQAYTFWDRSRNLHHQAQSSAIDVGTDMKWRAWKPNCDPNAKLGLWVGSRWSIPFARGWQNSSLAPCMDLYLAWHAGCL